MPSSSATALRAFNGSAPVLLAILFALAVGFHDWRGLAAAALGLTGTALYLYGTWVVVRVSGAGMNRQGPSRAQVAFVVLALLLKIPLIYVGWVLAQGLGPFGPTWFLAGLALVYSLLVWRAVLAVRD
jgi:hypothetical protein